jgi:hypothetical protein
MTPYTSQLKALLTDINSGDLTNCVNDAWAQSAVWTDEAKRSMYEVFVRIESIDTDTLTITYKYVTGMKE